MCWPYHYVGLDKMCDSSIEQTAQNVQTISAENVTVANTDSHDTETADDAVIGGHEPSLLACLTSSSML